MTVTQLFFTSVEQLYSEFNHCTALTMSREIGPDRAHFGGEDGVVAQIKNGKTSYYWECMNCQWRMGGKVFQNAKSRIHLSGDVRLRTGIINTVCKNAPN